MGRWTRNRWLRCGPCSPRPAGWSAPPCSPGLCGGPGLPAGCWWSGRPGTSRGTSPRTSTRRAGCPAHPSSAPPWSAGPRRWTPRRTCGSACAAWSRRSAVRRSWSWAPRWLRPRCSSGSATPASTPPCSPSTRATRSWSSWPTKSSRSSPGRPRCPSTARSIWSARRPGSRAELTRRGLRQWLNRVLETVSGPAPGSPAPASPGPRRACPVRPARCPPPVARTSHGLSRFSLLTL